MYFIILNTNDEQFTLTTKKKRCIWSYVWQCLRSLQLTVLFVVHCSITTCTLPSGIMERMTLRGHRYTSDVTAVIGTANTARKRDSLIRSRVQITWSIVAVMTKCTTSSTLQVSRAHVIVHTASIRRLQVEWLIDWLIDWWVFTKFQSARPDTSQQFRMWLISLVRERVILTKDCSLLKPSDCRTQLIRKQLAFTVIPAPTLQNRQGNFKVLAVQTESGLSVFLSSRGRQGSHSLETLPLCAFWLIRTLLQPCPRSRLSTRA